MNKCMLVGRLTKDVDYRDNGETTSARFSIAVDRRFKNKEGKYDADFINIVAFGKQADFISQYFHKGMKIGIVGRIQTGSYTNKEGQKIYTTDIFCEEAEFVESKSASAANQQAQNNTPVSNDGFMDVPDDMPEELPFN